MNISGMDEAEHPVTQIIATGFEPYQRKSTRAQYYRNAIECLSTWAEPTA
jgi:hypothetical protein